MFQIPDQMNAADYFVDRNLRQGRGNHVAVIDAGDGREYTYQEIHDQVNRFGNALREALATRVEERVLLLLLDSPAFVASFFGSIKIGAVPVPANTLLQPDEYVYLLNDTRARVLVVSAPLAAKVVPILPHARYLEHLMVVGEVETQGLPDALQVHDYRDLLEHASAKLAPETMTKDDACFWLYSSGTTGFPKGTVHLQHDMLFCVETYAKQVLQIQENDRMFSVAKLFFAYGLGNALYFPFAVGASTVLYPGKPDPESFYALIDRYKPSIFYCVPTAYAALLNYKDAARFDTSSLRLCVSAGEALPPALYKQWHERFGVEILDGIGSTEALHIFISNRPGQVKPGTSGKIVPGYEAKIVDENGQEVATGEVGDLWIRGDSICAYYWNQHQQTKETISGHWIRTGDKYCKDEEGYFHYQGRSDDMIKVSGMWVSPIEIENTLAEHPAVLESGVIGAPDETGLLKPKAFVVLKSGHEPSEDLSQELSAFVKARIAGFKYPRWIAYVDELPKTATGKIQRYKLRQRPA
ncbi:MAG: benzoate-CoA ligase family protein [bacterium]